MSELLLINPRRRRKAKRSSPKRRRNPVHAKSTHNRRRRVHRMSNPVAPLRRRRHRVSAVRHHNPRRRKHGYRRNPIAGLSVNSIMGMTKDAAIGAVGALAVDVAYGYVKGWLPASMQSPNDATGSVNPMYFLAKGGVAVLLGVLGKKLTNKAGHMAQGSLTVTMYDLLKGFVPASVNLGYVSPGHMAGSNASRTGPSQVFQARGMHEYVGMSGYESPRARETASIGEYAFR